MFPLPEAIIAVLVPFAPLFSRPVWVHVPVLVAGALLCRGPRTVAAVLRGVGLGEERRLARYHRVLDFGLFAVLTPRQTAALLRWGT